MRGLKFLLLLILAGPYISLFGCSQQQRPSHDHPALKFKKIADKGPVQESLCPQFGGQVVNFNDIESDKNRSAPLYKRVYTKSDQMPEVQSIATGTIYYTVGFGVLNQGIIFDTATVMICIFPK